MADSVIQLSTEDIPENLRRHTWCEEAMRAFVELDIEVDETPSFNAAFEKKTFNDWAVTHITSPRSLVRRRRHNIKGSDADCFMLGFQLKGTSTVSQDHRKTHLKPGDMVLYDTTRPFDLKLHSDDEQLVIEVPGQFARKKLNQVNKLTAIKLDHQREETRLCRSYLKSAYFDQQVTDDSSALLNELFTLFTNSLENSSPSLELAGANYENVRLFSIKDYVLQHLDNELLDQELVSNTFGISRRYLNRLFELEPQSFSEWLRHERLKKCSEDLRNPELAAFSVLDIAYKWGFKDPAHFSRVFKKHYQQTARDYRKTFLNN